MCVVAFELGDGCLNWPTSIINMSMKQAVVGPHSYAPQSKHTT